MSTGAIGKTNAPAPGTAIEIGVIDVSGKIQGVSATNPLPITGSIVSSNPSVGPTGAAVPASATYEGMNVGGNLVGLTGTSNGLKVDGSAVTQPVSAASLPLPTGASTAALQTTGNTSLSSIDGKLGSLGQKTMAGSAPVVIASDQSAVPVSGTVTVSGTVAATQSGNWTTRIQDSSGNSITIGQKTMVNSVPVVISNDQSAVTVAGTVSINALTNASVVKAQLQDNSGNAITLAQKAMTSSVPVVIASDQSAVAVSGTVTANAGSGTFAVSGTITANAGTGTFAVDPAQTNVGSNGAVGSITGSSLTGSYATVVTPGFASRLVQIFNSCNTTIKVSLDGGTTDFFILEAGESTSLDLGTNGRKIAASTNLSAKHNGAAPTAGTIRISAIG